MQTPWQIYEYELNLTASIGIAVYPEDGDDAMTLVKNADNALYEVKESGRNTYRFYEARPR